jgi:short-subunit dehydrogenase involved in D-alanine esterification of teichoic acids
MRSRAWESSIVSQPRRLKKRSSWLRRGKKVTSRKRHLMVDTLGLLLTVVVHSADVQDRDGAKLLVERLKCYLPRLHLLFADGGKAAPWN